MGFTKSPDPQCAINCYEGAEVFFVFFFPDLANGERENRTVTVPSYG